MFGIRTFIIAGTIAVAAVSGAASLSSGSCGRCEEDFALFCHDSWIEHRFRGIVDEGYEGYHTEDECGTCEESHPFCGVNKIEQNISSAILDERDITPVLEQLSERVTYDRTSGVLKVMNCAGTSPSAVYELTDRQRQALNAKYGARSVALNE